MTILWHVKMKNETMNKWKWKTYGMNDIWHKYDMKWNIKGMKGHKWRINEKNDIDWKTFLKWWCIRWIWPDNDILLYDNDIMKTMTMKKLIW